MFRIEGRDADALGLPVTPAEDSKRPKNLDELNEQMQKQLMTVYDPEIPVNIVDLGLVYSCEPTDIDGGWKVNVKMTHRAWLRHGPVLQQDAQNRLLCIDGVDEVDVEIVWDPPWNRDMMRRALANWA